MKNNPNRKNPNKKPEPGSGPSSPSATGRKYISVLFECCGIYNRVYINRAKTAYVGWCPKCCRRLEVKIGPDGIDCRFFKAE